MTCENIIYECKILGMCKIFNGFINKLMHIYTYTYIYNAKNYAAIINIEHKTILK